MKAKLKELFQYNFDCNEEIIKAIEPFQDALPQRIIEITNHLINSHIFWNNRILGKPDNNRWQIHSFNDLISLNQENHFETGNILQNQEMEEIISFRNSKGTISTATIQDIYFHLINHGTYHRGQLALLFRQSGILEPIRTDYIFWKIKDQL